MMLGECENVLSVPEMELETLQSIYVNELEVNYNDGVPCSVALWLHPATADNLEEQYVRIFLIFNLPEKYPDSIPDISIRNPRGLSDEQITRIVQKLLSIAENIKGASMLFELIEAAKEQLTAENRPSEDCAICLYGFMEEDVFTKTECYHYFHSHCLNRYLQSKHNEDCNQDENASKRGNKKPLCPVCRVPITFNLKSEEFPEPIAVAEAYVSLTTTSNEHQEEMERLYQKQLAQGGIIDVEAEKNKFLLEIANVPTDRGQETQEIAKAVVDNHSKDSRCEKPNDEVSATRSRKDVEDSSPSFNNYNNAKSGYRGSYKQPYRKNYDRSNDFREQKKFTTNNRYQNRKPRYNNIPDAQLKNERENDEEFPDDRLKDSTNSEIHSVGEQASEVDTSSDYRSSNHYGSRYNKQRTNNQHTGSRNYYNGPPNRSYRNYNDGHWKSRGGSNQKKYGDYQNQANNSPHHAELVDDEKFAKECAIKDDPSEVDEHITKVECKEVAEKSYSKRYEWNDKRYNYRNQSRFQGDQNSHTRFPRNRENFQEKSNSASLGVTEVAESDGTAVNLDRNFNSRPYRPRYQDQHRRYGGHTRSYHTNDTNYPMDDTYNKGQNHSSGYSGYQQAHSSKYRGNSYNTNRKYNDTARNGNGNYKHSFKGDVSKKESCPNEEVPDNPSKVNVENHSEQLVSGSSTKPVTETNYTKISDSYVKPSEKCSATMRPPPGFANPLKKVVYGLPSVNPPPGFGQS